MFHFVISTHDHNVKNLKYIYASFLSVNLLCELFVHLLNLLIASLKCHFIFYKFVLFFFYKFVMFVFYKFVMFVFYKFMFVFYKFVMFIFCIFVMFVYSGKSILLRFLEYNCKMINFYVIIDCFCPENKSLIN